MLQVGTRALCGAFSEAATEVLARMLEPVPEARISIDEVLNSAWLQPVRLMPPPSVTPNQGSKWSVLLGDRAGPDPVGVKRKRPSEPSDGEKANARPSDEARGGGGAGGAAGEGTETPRWRQKDSGEEEEVVPPGVNGLLVRSLGWVQLPTEKETMVAAMSGTLDQLGVKYSIVRGELSDVVRVGGTTRDGHGSPGTSDGEATSEMHSEGQLTVRIRIHQSGEGDGAKTDFHMDRQTGDVLQFHSFYRSVVVVQ